MCESRVLPCPKGSAVWQKGETREEGGHVLEGISQLANKKRFMMSFSRHKPLFDIVRAN